MQLIVQVNSQRENQSESVAIISSRQKQNKTKQKVANPQKKVPRAWGISDCVKEQNSRHNPM